jgi:hypothetical protein
MSGVRFGPLEVFVNCDRAGCRAEGLIWSGQPEDEIGEPPLPPAWTRDGGKTYCPRHSR